jgi:predicted amidophosphoribosyltransferase
MGLFSALAQCALDFLVEERCHACGRAVDAARFPDPLPPLAVPLEVATFPLKVTSRLFCAECAGGLKRWVEPVSLAHPASAEAAHRPIELYPAFITDEKLLTVIHLLKFGRHECIATWLARAMMSGLPALACGADTWGGGPTWVPDRWHRDAPATGQTVSERPYDGWLVVPVPMDRRARSRRGFNQAESLARALAADWELPTARAGVLVKLRRTLPQSAHEPRARVSRRCSRGARRARDPGGRPRDVGCYRSRLRARAARWRSGRNPRRMRRLPRRAAVASAILTTTSNGRYHQWSAVDGLTDAGRSPASERFAPRRVFVVA